MSFQRRTFAFGALLAVLAVGTPAPSLSAQSLNEEMLNTIQYRSIGPTRQSGRFVDIAVPMSRPHTFYIATASGHLWKSENNGITFDILFENEDVFSIGAIAVSQSNPDILYLGSGEANNSRSSYWGDGVYKSTDAGESWTNIGLPESHHIGRIVVHPTNPDIVYVAALGHLYSENPERGLYKTTDGGDSWEKVLAHRVDERDIGVVDVVMDPSDPQTLYAATFDKVRLPFTYDLGGPGSRLWKTTDGGENWQMLTNGLPGGMLGRIGVAVYERNPDILYTTIENANKEGMSAEERRQELLNHESSSGMIGGEIYRSNDGGETWEKASPDDESIGGRPAYYYGQIRIDPNDANHVYVLSIRTWETTDGGENWARAWNFGGDDHALWINPEDSDHMIMGYDHGMGVTWDGGENWDHPDNQSLAQFYAVGYDMSYPYRVAGGLQDNGSHMAPHTNIDGGPLYFEQWERVGGGDGMYNEFDTCNNRYLYNESQFGPIARLDLLTGEREGIRYDGDGSDDLRYNWNAPILVSPHDCNVIYHAANRLLRSDYRGEDFQLISPDLTRADPATLTTGRGGDGNIQYATITAIDESPLRAGVLWVGTDDGNVQVSRDGGENWTLVNDNIPNNPEYWVSRVEASHHDIGTAYISYTGYRRDDFRPFVYKTTDFGATWTDISSNLPMGPINVVREHHQNPDLLFVGTEFQVFVSNDGGMNWVSMKNNMPTQPVHDMKIHPRENDLIVATHGRGIYIADISPLVEMTPAALAEDAFFFQPEDRIRWVSDDRTNYASSNFDGESEPLCMAFYYTLNEAAESVNFTVYQGEYPISRIEGETEAGFHMLYWNMDRMVERSEEEAAAMRERMQGGGGGFGFGGFGGFGGGSQCLPQASRDDRIQYEISDAPAGTYRVVMDVDGTTLERTVEIIADQWWESRR